MGKIVYNSNPANVQYDDLILEKGLVFELRGRMNDAKLIGLGYVVEVEDGADLVRCIGCGKDFIDDSSRNAHARRAAHSAVTLDGPTLRAPARSLNTANIDPDSSAEWPAETTPTQPPPLAEETGVALDRGLQSDRGRRGGAQRASETIRLGA